MVTLIGWISVIAYLLIAYGTYRYTQYSDLKELYSREMESKDKHVNAWGEVKSCQFMHSTCSHEVWAYNRCREDRNPVDYIAISVFWPVILIVAPFYYGIILVKKSVKVKSGLKKEVEKAEERFQLEKFAKEEGLSWNLKNSDESLPSVERL